MKRNHGIRLLSVLLCLLLLCVGCSTEQDAGGAETSATSDTQAAPSPQETEAVTDAPEEDDGVIEPVAPILKNFFAASGSTSFRDLKAVARMEGECVDEADGLFVFRTAKLDAMNQVTETYTVYNARLAKTVLTLTNTYAYSENYESFVFGEEETLRDGDAQYPSRVLELTVESSADGTIPYIKASVAKITPIEQEVFDEHQGNSHTVQTAYTYYDGNGQKLAEAEIDRVTQLDTSVLQFGAVAVTFDEDGYKTHAVSAENEVIRRPYDRETEKYGYYMDQYQVGALGETRAFFEVYRKDTEQCVLRYYPDRADQMMAFVLSGGDVLIQYCDAVEEDGQPYDLMLMEQKMKVRSVIVDVPTGKVTEITLTHLILGLTDRQTLGDTLDELGIEVRPTENVVNFSLAVPFGSKIIDLETGAYGTELRTEILILNNDGSVLYVLDRMVPEHHIPGLWEDEENPFGFTILSTGDYLVTLDGGVARYAIVSSDMKVRAYLPDGAWVVGGYVVTDEAVYDFDLNLLYRFEESGTEFAFAIGEKIILSRSEEDDPDSFVYYELQRTAGDFTVKELFSGMKATVEALTEDYVILYDVRADKYVLYNAELKQLLVTQNEMEISLFGEKYIICTRVTDVSAGRTYSLYYTVES